MLTPVSSASSPELHPRSCRHSPFQEHQQHPHPHQHHQHHQEDSSSSTAAQQPTPPHTASMYPYPEYMHTNQGAPSSMPPMPGSTVAEANNTTHHDLLPYLHASPPGHDDAGPHHHHHPPPQSNPYFGSYTVSAAAHEQEQQQQQQYYHLPPHAPGDTIGGLGLLRQDVNGGGGGGAYTHHRPLAPITQQQQHAMFHPSHFRLPRLEPTTTTTTTTTQQHGRQYSVARARRDRTRKNSARLSMHRRDSFSPPQQQQQHGSYMHACEDVVGLAMAQMEDDAGPDEEVTLDEKTPTDLQRLWDVRRKWIGKKGNGMWENIMVDYLGEESLTENKKTQVKASLQMKIHRMLLKHGKWPERDVSV